MLVIIFHPFPQKRCRRYPQSVIKDVTVAELSHEAGFGQRRNLLNILVAPHSRPAVCRCRRVEEAVLVVGNAGNGGGIAVQRRRAQQEIFQLSD